MLILVDLGNPRLELALQRQGRQGSHRHRPAVDPPAEDLLGLFVPLLLAEGQGREGDVHVVVEALCSSLLVDDDLYQGKVPCVFNALEPLE